MPVYEYRCENCGHDFEELKKMADRKTNRCPKCGEQAKQIITPVHFDYRMGTSLDFPTMAEKWARIQKSKNRKFGGMWDSNNNRWENLYEREKKRD